MFYINYTAPPEAGGVKAFAVWWTDGRGFLVFHDEGEAVAYAERQSGGSLRWARGVGLHGDAVRYNVAELWPGEAVTRRDLCRCRVRRLAHTADASF